MLVVFLACPIGFEPTVSRVGVLCVIQLRYGQMLSHYTTGKIKSKYQEKSFYPFHRKIDNPYDVWYNFFIDF